MKCGDPLTVRSAGTTAIDIHGIRYHAKEMPRLGGGLNGSLRSVSVYLPLLACCLFISWWERYLADGNRLVEILRNTRVRQDQPGSLRYLQSVFDGPIP
jgi:hypothetical protein